MADIKITGDNLKGLLSLDKQLAFAASRALNAVAREAQTSVIKAIENTFVVRGKWYLPRTPLGIKTTLSRKDNLEASVHTSADFLAQHETGGTKTAPSGKLAIPIVGTGTARPRLTSKLRKELKPRALGSRAFILQTKSGPVLFYRRGKKQRLTALYQIEPSARIRKQSTVIEPTEKVVARRFDSIFERELVKALESAK